MSKADVVRSKAVRSLPTEARAETRTEASKASPAPSPAKAQPGDVFFTLPDAGTFTHESTIAELDAVLGQQGPHTSLSRAAVETMSFSKLAATDLPTLFDSVSEQLQRIGPDTAPDDSAIRPVRKSTERLRNNLDLFASVYPPGGDTGWKALRKHVDAVYESLGGLKNLTNSGLQAETTLGWDTVPSPADEAAVKLQNELLPERQTRVVDAKTALLADAPVFREMLSNPTSKPKHLKEHDHIDSRFYWGGVPIKPKDGKSGIENVRRLLKGQVDVALEKSKHVMKLEDPIGDKREKEFHDFRKRVRSLINVAAYFPEVFKEPAAGVELQRKLYSLVYEYGEIEDRLVAARTAATLGAPEGRAAAEAEVKQLWPQLVQWQKDQKINGVLKEFAAALGPET